MADDITPGAENPDDLAKRFAELVATWREETRYRCRVKAHKEHAAFREIVALGEKAVPLILAHLE